MGRTGVRGRSCTPIPLCTTTAVLCSHMACPRDSHNELEPLECIVLELINPLNTQYKHCSSNGGK